jgi:hypothetical protein
MLPKNETPMQRRTRNRYPGIIRVTPWCNRQSLSCPGTWNVVGRLRVDTGR